jgi:hypothetical protein
MKVIGFLTEQDLQKYITTNAIDKTKTVAIYFNAASGRVVLVHTV